MPRRSDDQGNNNWRRLWEVNIKFRLQAARAWLQRLYTSSSSSGTLSVPPFAYDFLEEVTMSTNPVIQALEDQFLHWHQNMGRKHEEQVRQMKEL